MNQKNPKCFLNIDEQIDHLEKNRNLKINNKEKLKFYLTNYNYQIFINGYNNQFLKGFRRSSNQYINGVNEESIINLFNFDRWLSKIILSNIQNFERKFNTAICYCVAEKLKKIGIENGEIWLLNKHQLNQIYNFNDSKEEKIQKLNSLFESIFEKMKGSKIFKKYKNQKDSIPIWTLFIFASFGDLIKFFNYLNDELKIKVLKFGFKNKFKKIIIFNKVINILKKIRNRCCHCNVLYDFESDSDKKNLKCFLENEIKHLTSNIRIFDIIKILDYLVVSNNNVSISEMFEKKFNEKIIKSNSIPEVCINELKKIMNFKK